MIVAAAPLRLPLGGGGTDLASYYQRYGGFFVSAAIDKYVYVCVERPAADDLIRVKYSRSEEVRSPDEVQHDLVRHALQELEVTRNIEIASMADVPAGSGLGSSGSYVVALLMALHALKQDHIPRWALAEEACHIEIDLAQHSVGKQDQYVSAWGGLNTYSIDQQGEVMVAPLPMPTYVQDDLEQCLLLYYLGITRESENILAQQKQDSEAGDPIVIESLHRTKELGHEVATALTDGDLVRFGELMDEHWQNKMRRSDLISSTEINRLYAIGREHGAIGGKLVGAGGGGFLMLLAPHEATREVRRALSSEGLREMLFRFDLEGAKILLNAHK